ncbi:Transposase [Rubripirellula lacrimiformis]|uniref:Transposase n=1 Tax=Rubripirellula lacrimiformis TaxID=1930273 RepID=A0A517NBH2_9BACT|nr:Transposase [Rubripirellula lacrimiformis]QDT04199.1 Transposase [Rubripirellula lacrimiformis]QDT04486.1 Transposase [Rubripirellula lacrimiformis]QDT06918.1 Transposase [Rubripirellula lacrimiformis]QDT06929.1 Transposase [Rubripirellula lacrimiformis]
MTDTANKKIEKDPEVTQKAARRRFTADYKRRIALEAESCSEPGEIGALLRREGIYSSVLAKWRRQLREESLSSSKKSNGKTSPADQLKRLERENERLKEKLRHAELIIDVQKKVSEMMQIRSHEKDD